MRVSKVEEPTGRRRRNCSGKERKEGKEVKEGKAGRREGERTNEEQEYGNRNEKENFSATYNIQVYTHIKTVTIQSHQSIYQSITSFINHSIY